jgi:hypothetical protein
MRDKNGVKLYIEVNAKIVPKTEPNNKYFFTLIIYYNILVKVSQCQTIEVAKAKNAFPTSSSQSKIRFVHKMNVVLFLNCRNVVERNFYNLRFSFVRKETLC